MVRRLLLHEPGFGLEAGDAAGEQARAAPHEALEQGLLPGSGLAEGVCSVLAGMVYPERRVRFTRAVNNAVPASPVGGDAEAVIRG